jgi:SAM-dependent methyltransferase/uncharacterized protein YbaR (Trm112 family)
LSHFAALRPVCPRCAADGRQEALSEPKIFAESGGHILMGLLQCPSCGQEYPILDGLPLLVPSVQSYVSQCLPVLMERRDLPDALESLIGDAAGPGSTLDGVRQHLSSYGWDHWAEHDPGEARSDDSQPGAVARCLAAGLAALPNPAEGPALDLGCGPGRSSAELTGVVDGLVLGVDLSFPVIRLAARALQDGRVRYPRRRIGMVYDMRDFAVTLADPEKLDFWVCDALALPFREESFGLATGLNLLDCLSSPMTGLAAVGRVLRPGGQAILASPYDWSPSVTPPEQWVGGHSQRADHQGSAEPLMRRALSAENPSSGGLRLTAERADIPWQVRVHDRAIMRYKSHLVIAEKAGKNDLGTGRAG